MLVKSSMATSGSICKGGILDEMIIPFTETALDKRGKETKDALEKGIPIFDTLRLGDFTLGGDVSVDLTPYAHDNSDCRTEEGEEETMITSSGEGKTITVKLLADDRIIITDSVDDESTFLGRADVTGITASQLGSLVGLMHTPNFVTVMKTVIKGLGTPVEIDIFTMVMVTISMRMDRNMEEISASHRDIAMRTMSRFEVAGVFRNATMKVYRGRMPLETTGAGSSSEHGGAR